MIAIFSAQIVIYNTIRTNEGLRPMQHERRKSMSKKETSGLTIKHKVGYGLGDAGGCMTFALMTGMFTR